MRIIGILVVFFIGMTTGCDTPDPCIQVGEDEEFGADFLQKVELVSIHARELGLPTTPEEAALIIGASYAESQIEGGQAGVPVRICLRPGNQGDTEFRVLTRQGKILREWVSSKDIGG